MYDLLWEATRGGMNFIDDITTRLTLDCGKDVRLFLQDQQDGSRELFIVTGNNPVQGDVVICKLPINLQQLLQLQFIDYGDIIYNNDGDIISPVRMNKGSVTKIKYGDKFFMQVNIIGLDIILPLQP
eukprot:UN10850